MITTSDDKLEQCEQFDYIVIGGGSAGSVLAARLSEDRTNSVLLLEAGGSDINAFVAAPMGETQLLETSFDWAFKSEQEKELNNAVLTLSRGKVLGGSSSINGQLHFRGLPGDYDHWEALGNRNWGYKDILPYFKNMERWQGGEDQFRGACGPIHATKSTDNNPLFEAFVAAGESLGFPRIDDVNQDQEEGFGHCQFTHFRYPVLRCAASYGYLFWARWRKNLTIRKNALVSRIVIQDKVAKGVSYLHEKQPKTVRARKEVILSAGPYQSPKILMLSGIGDRDHLEEHGIKTAQHLPGVGKNLMDHIGSFVQHACAQPITYYKYVNPFHAGVALLEWLILGKGPFTIFPMASTAFVKSSPDLDRPDIQYYMYPVAVNPHEEGTFMPKSHAYNIHWGIIRPKSRGDVTLRSSHFSDPPVIKHNFFHEEEDKKVNRYAFRLARDIHNQDVFGPYRGSEVAPGSACQSDQDIDQHTSRYFANHYHACGTCKMGNDEMSVVNDRLQVQGIKNLRVIDSSIMPEIVSGGLNIPSMMIGEKGAAMILNKENLTS